MKDYELAVMNVKSILFDLVYREQGLLDIHSKTNNGLSPEAQLSLPTLYTKQQGDIKKVLDLLTQFDVSMKDILKTSEQIVELTKGGNVELADMDVVKSDVAPIENSGVDNIQPAVIADTVVSENKVTQNVENASQSAVEQQVPVDTSANIEPVLAPLVADDNGVNTAANTMPSTPEVSADSVSINPVQPTIEENVGQNNAVVQQSAVTDSINPSVTSNPVAVEQTATPVNEVIQVSSQTNALDDNDTQDTVTSGFVLSPIDDGVLPAPIDSQTAMTPEQGISVANQQLQAVQDVKQEIINDPQLTDEEKQKAIDRYTRATADVVKAILVTKAQYEKLAASKQSQQALVSSNQEVVSSSTEKSDASSLLTSDIQDKQKEMEIMMNQANTLYKEGKTQEAQEIYNKISDMNKAIQAPAATETAPAELVKK